MDMNDVIIATNIITSNVVNDLLFSTDTSVVVAGEYTLVITFNVGAKSVKIYYYYRSKCNR